MRGHVVILAAAALVAAALAISGSGAAQNVPVPDTNDLGISQNDVRNEPNHKLDDNGFPHLNYQPKNDQLVLEAYTENGPLEEDYSNIVNVLLHGDQYDDYENYMFPGLVSYQAYWGWWSDTGGGGDLQSSPATSGTILTSNSGNGAIDDADDCGDANWDEFTWRGPNANTTCSSQHNTVRSDVMYAFIEPGTHDIQILSLGAGISNPEPVGEWMASEHDGERQADFAYGNAGDGEGWQNAFGWSRIEYDSSMLITTRVTTAVNPPSDPADDTAYKPFSPDTTAVDVDVYTTLHPMVEDAYRTTVWDPPNDYGDKEDEENLVSERGPKGIAKDEVNTQYEATKEDAMDTAQSQNPNGITGFARNLVQGPRLHEPTTAGDQYGFRDTNDDGTLEKPDWATFGRNTSYGGLDDDDGDGDMEYYEPGTNQMYTGYKAGEHLWIDSLVSVNLEPNWVGIVGIPEGRLLSPELPDPSEPAASLSEEEDDHTAAPGFVYASGHFGTWYDANEDTFVGDADDNPYQQGFRVEPHNYYNSSEFQGIPFGNLKATTTFIPLNDTDGDGVADWGRAGVYKLDYLSGNPYGQAYMDVAGDAGEPVLDPLRSNSQVGGAVGFVAPDDENGRLSRHHLQGKITFDSWYWNEQEQPAGEWHTSEMLFFPTGSANIWFKTVTEVTYTGDRLGEHGDTKKVPLNGEKVRDVDIVRSIQSSAN